jgi:hypothetical protein
VRCEPMVTFMKRKDLPSPLLSANSQGLRTRQGEG